MKQLRSTWILLALALLIGGYIYWGERGPAARPGQTVLLRTDPNAVQTLQLREGASGVQFSRVGEGWRVARLPNGQAQVAVPADAEAVEKLLGVLQLVQSDALVSGGDPKAFGLDAPRKKLTVDNQSIEFGTSPSFDPGHIYARVGTQIALLPIALGRTLAIPFEAWRDTRLLTFDEASASSLRFQTPALRADLEKDAGTWKITAPLATQANTEAVQALFATLASTKIAKWLDEDGTRAAKWGLTKPIATLRVGDATLTVGKKQADGYAARNNRSNSVFLLPTAVFEAFNRPLGAWRSRHVLPLRLPDLTQITLIARGGRKTFVPNDGRWSLVGGSAAGDAANALNSHVLDVATWALKLQARDFFDHPQNSRHYGLDKPILALELAASDQLVTLKIGHAYNANYASVGGDTVYEVAPDALDDIKDALDALFSTATPQPTATKNSLR